MGDIYIFFPLTRDAELQAWLATWGIVGLLDEESRHPTENDIRRALDNLENYAVEYRRTDVGWDANIWRVNPPDIPDSTTLWIKEHADASPSISFHKGSLMLNAQIVRCLSQLCGPLVFYSASVSVPVLVAPSTELRAALTAAGYITG